MSNDNRDWFDDLPAEELDSVIHQLSFFMGLTVEELDETIAGLEEILGTASQNGTIIGVARDAEGKPLPADSAAIFAHNPDTDQILGESKIAQDGTFVIKNVPLNTSLLVNGSSDTYGFGFEKPAHGNESEPFALTSSDPKHIILTFTGSRKLAVHFLQPEKGAKKDNEVTLQVEVTGEHGPCQLIIRRGKQQHCKVLSVNWNRAPVDMKLDETNSNKPFSLGEFKTSAAGTLTFSSDEKTQPYEEIIVGVIVAQGEKAFLQEQEFFVRPIYVADRINVQSEHDKVVEVVEKLVKVWDNQFDQEEGGLPWNGELGTAEDLAAFIYKHFDSEESVAEVKRNLDEMHIDQTRIFRYWLNTMVGRRKNAREFVVRWMSANAPHIKNENNETIIRRLLRDYWSPKYDPPGVNIGYKHQSIRLGIGYDFIVMTYKFLTDAQYTEEDLVLTVKAALRQLSAPEDVVNDIETFADLARERKTFLEEKKRGKT